MTGKLPPPGDRARVSILVRVDPEEAFRVFTEEIDQWWRRGPKYRVAGGHKGFVRVEPGVGGRIFESFETASGNRVVQTGTVTLWEPPGRLAFEWRGGNFAPEERTQVEVVFERQSNGTLVTVVHRGWSSLRPDHPARHGLETAAFVRMLGLWWSELLGSLREHARGPGSVPPGGH